MDEKLSNQQLAVAGAVPLEDEGFEHEEANTGMIALVGGAIVLVIIVVVIAITYLYDFAYDQQVSLRVEQPVSQELLDLRAKEDSDLYQYKYIDRSAGTVRLPIDRAEELLIKEAADGKLKYPTAPAPVKSAAEIAGPGGVAPKDSAGAAPKDNVAPIAK
jgi:hypothetical protein